MKKIVILSVVALMLGMTMPAMAGPPTMPPPGAHHDVNFVTKLSYTAPLFSDTFDGGLSQWTQISGTWGIVDDSGNNVCSVSGGSHVGGVVATAGSDGWTNYTLDLDAKKVAGRYLYVIFRYTNQNNHYLLAGGHHITLFRKVGGSGYERLTPLGQETVPDQWYHYKVVLQGPSIKVYVDGTLQIDIIDNSLPAGKVGIGAYTGSAAYFDDVQVMGVDPNEVLIAFNGSVPGLKYIAGSTFAILDHDAGVLDGDEAILQLPLTAVYDVYCSARGAPGGHIHWGCDHERNDVPAGKPTWHQHSPDNFSLGNYGSPLGPYPITTSQGATILATRWYPQP